MSPISMRHQGWLTGALLLLLLTAPIFEGSQLAVLVLALLGNVIVLAGLYAVSWNNRRLAAGLILALPNVVMAWSYVVHPTFAIGAGLALTSIVFFVYTLVTILQRIFRTKEVGVEELFGALNVYILVGVSWGLCYFLLHSFAPGAFSLGDLPPSSSTFVYYSFSTLGTLGIGDVRPVLPLARSLSVIEMLLGLFFVAALFGRLVAVFHFEIGLERAPKPERAPFERTVLFVSHLPQWSFVPVVAAADLFTSIVNEQLHMPLFLDTWATSTGVMLGGLAVGVVGGVFYNLLMAAFFWGPAAWVWAFNTALVALLTHYFWRRHRIDINRPIQLIGCALVIAIGSSLLGTAIINIAGLPRNASTLAIHTIILDETGSLFAADFCQQVLMESIDKIVSLAIAAIVVFAIQELRKPSSSAL